MLWEQQTREIVFVLTNISIAYSLKANNTNQDQTAQITASDQRLHCLLTERSIKI